MTSRTILPSGANSVILPVVRVATQTCRWRFRLSLNFLYFNVVRYGYLQASVLVPYIALAPSIVAEAAVPRP